MLSPEDEDDWSPEILRMEISDLVNEGERIRLEHRRELLNLRAQLAPINKTYLEKLDSVDLSTYQKEIHSSFQGAAVVPYVTKIQAQLCHALHTQEVYQRQIKVAQRGNKRLIVNMTKEIKHLKRESALREGQLMEDLANDKAIMDKQLDMFEQVIAVQEDELKTLREQLGLGTKQTGNGEKGRRISTSKQLKKISGSIRNIMKKNSLSETPNVLKDSKIWTELEEAEQRDRDEKLELERIRKNAPSKKKKFGNYLIGDRSENSSTTTPTTPQREDSSSNGSIINTVFGSFYDDSDSLAGDGVGYSRQLNAATGISALAPAEELSPTSKAYKQLSEEVFSNDFDTLQL